MIATPDSTTPLLPSRKESEAANRDPNRSQLHLLIYTIDAICKAKWVTDRIRKNDIDGEILNSFDILCERYKLNVMTRLEMHDADAAKCLNERIKKAKECGYVKSTGFQAEITQIEDTLMKVYGKLEQQLLG